jgi:hypothetical protein
MLTNAATKIENAPRATSNQPAMVAELVERALSALGSGRALIVSLDRAQRIVGVCDVSMAVYARMEDAKWELEKAVSKKAHAVIVGFQPSIPGDTERFVRTIGTILSSPILELVVNPITVRNPQNAASGWIRRSTVSS